MISGLRVSPNSANFLRQGDEQRRPICWLPAPTLACLLMPYIYCLLFDRYIPWGFEQTGMCGLNKSEGTMLAAKKIWWKFVMQDAPWQERIIRQCDKLHNLYNLFLLTQFSLVKMYTQCCKYFHFRFICSNYLLHIDHELKINMGYLIKRYYVITEQKTIKPFVKLYVNS